MDSSNASWSLVATPAGDTAITSPVVDTDAENLGDSVPMDSHIRQDSSDSDVAMHHPDWVQSVRTEVEAIEKQQKRSRKMRRKAAEVGSSLDVNVEVLRQKLLDMQLQVKVAQKTSRRRLDTAGSSLSSSVSSTEAKMDVEEELLSDPSAPVRTKIVDGMVSMIMPPCPIIHLQEKYAPLFRHLAQLEATSLISPFLDSKLEMQRSCSETFLELLQFYTSLKATKQNNTMLQQIAAGQGTSGIGSSSSTSKLDERFWCPACYKIRIEGSATCLLCKNDKAAVPWDQLTITTLPVEGGVYTLRATDEGPQWHFLSNSGKEDQQMVQAISVPADTLGAAPTASTSYEEGTLSFADLSTGGAVSFCKPPGEGDDFEGEEAEPVALHPCITQALQALQTLPTGENFKKEGAKGPTSVD